MMNRGDRMNQSPILLQRSVVFLQWVCFLFIVFENLTLFRFVLDQSYADMWQKVSSNNVRFWVINNDEQGWPYEPIPDSIAKISRPFAKLYLQLQNARFLAASSGEMYLIIASVIDYLFPAVCWC